MQFWRILKNFENRLIFAKDIDNHKVGRFWATVYFCSTNCTILQNATLHPGKNISWQQTATILLHLHSTLVTTTTGNKNWQWLLTGLTVRGWHSSHMYDDTGWWTSSARPIQSQCCHIYNTAQDTDTSLPHSLVHGPQNNSNDWPAEPSWITLIDWLSRVGHIQNTHLSSLISHNTIQKNGSAKLSINMA